MELLIGAGRRREKVFGGSWDHLVTLDLDPETKPDVVWDLDNIPLPFGPHRFDEIHCIDVLEHTGRQGDWKFFFSQMNDFYRILKPGGTFNCLAPRADSVWAWGDPGHVRVITAEQLCYLNRPNYAQVGKTPMTDYRGVLDSDWDITRLEYREHHLAFSIQAIKPQRIA